MGQEKALLEVGREAMIRRVAGVLKEVFAEVIISGGVEENGLRLGLRVVPDLIAGGGPLSGIHAALCGAAFAKCLVVACDMPFICPELARYMMEQSEGYDVAVPRHGQHLQPLFAVYSKGCIRAIEESLRAHKCKVIDFYPLVRVNYVSEENLRALADIEVAFFNVNTPSDLVKARVMAENSRTGRVWLV